MIIKIDCPYQCSNTFPVLLAFGYEYLRWPGGICNTAAIVQSLSFVRLFATPWTVAHQAPLSTGLPRQEHWSGLPFPPPGDLPDLGIEPASPALAGIFFTTEPPGKPSHDIEVILKKNRKRERETGTETEWDAFDSCKLLTHDPGLTIT